MICDRGSGPALIPPDLPRDLCNPRGVTEPEKPSDPSDEVVAPAPVPQVAVEPEEIVAAERAPSIPSAPPPPPAPELAATLEAAASTEIEPPASGDALSAPKAEPAEPPEPVSPAKEWGAALVMMVIFAAVALAFVSLLKN